MKLLATAAVVGLFVASAVRADGPCPKRIILEGAQFINHQEFPTEAQIEKNFNQSIVEAGNEAPAWNDGHLAAARDFVRTVQENYKNGQLVITTEPNTDCGGTLGKIKFRAQITGVDFLFDDTADIGVEEGHDSPVTFEAFLPSNCSNCLSTAELFQFRNVTVVQ